MCVTHWITNILEFPRSIFRDRSHRPVPKAVGDDDTFRSFQTVPTQLQDISILTLPPFPAEMICGELRGWMEHARTPNKPVTGVWWPKNADQLPTTDGDLVGLYFHGGGYIIGSALTQGGFARIPRGLIERKICARVLSIDYTLVSPEEPSTSFPRQLLEALAGYHYLLATLHIPPQRILLVGDSAGGHLVLALARYITESGCFDACPRGVVLFSPWCDMTDLEHPGIKAFRGSHPLSLLHSPYFSASLHEPPPCWPPTFVASGMEEVFHVSIAALVDQLRKIADVTWQQAEGIVGRYSHDFLIYDVVGRMYPARVEECWERLGGWAAHIGHTAGDEGSLRLRSSDAQLRDSPS
ncbi:alpha/beta-hydrolase [Leucogyrophana mollusca]|uniref:Alpha/beta-hydrolase n=1 Tax=Leucogyrophana mollusca TaxID=85980 RepID=A0ACB8BXI4_9AGAM|nr:alpha/beta-hydrolase [Leucogyrophana mollusca]